MAAVAGRPTVLTPHTAERLVELRRDGFSVAEAAAELGISRRSAFRALAGARGQGTGKQLPGPSRPRPTPRRSWPSTSRRWSARSFGRRTATGAQLRGYSSARTPSAGRRGRRRLGYPSRYRATRSPR